MQLTDSLKTLAEKSKPSSSSPMVQPSNETASTSIRQGETVLKSLWFQRFKLRDDAEEAKRKPAEVDLERPSLDVFAAPSESLYPSDQAGQKKGVEEGCPSIREGHVGASQQEKASQKPDLPCGDQTKWNTEKSSVPDSSRPIMNKQKDHAVDLQSQRLTEGKEVAARHLIGVAPAVPVKSGFGPWIKAKAGIRLEEKSQLEQERIGPTPQRVFHGSGTSNFPSPLGSSQTCKQAGEREQAAAAGGTSRLTNSVWRSDSGGTPTEEIAHASLGKPPLPPLRPGARGRPKFASRPISLKTQGRPFLPGRLSPSPCVQGIPVPERVIPVSQLVVPAVQMPISREGVAMRKVVAVDEARLTRVIEETGLRGGASLEDPSPSKLSCNELDSVHPMEHGVNFVETGPHRTVLSASHTENNGMVSAHMVSFGNVVPAIELSQSMLYNQSTRRKSTMVYPPPISPQNKGEPSEGSGAINENATEATGVETAGLPSTPTVTDFPLEQPVHSIKESKMVKSGEVLQIDVDELNGDVLQPMPVQGGGSLETSRGASRSDKPDEGANESMDSPSSTASYPWGLFIGAAGTSRKAREQFVEVYNRARDDLKNQRTSHIVSRVPDKEMDDCARLASAGQMANVCDVPNCRLERQALESQKQPVGNLHRQESFEALNGELEPTFEHAGQNAKALKLCLPEREQPQNGQQVGSVVEGNVWRSQDKGSQTFQVIHGANGRAVSRVEGGQHGNSPAVPAMGFAFNACSNRHGETVIVPKHNEGLKEGELQFKVNQKIPQERLIHQNKDCQRKFEQRSDAVVRAACQVPWPEGVSNNRGDKKGGVSLLGKRPRGVFPEAAISGIHTAVTGKVYIDGTERPRTEMPSNRPRVWLQRWQSTPHIGEGMQGHTHGQVKGAGQHAYDDFALGSFKKDTNSNNLVGQTTELRSFAQTVEKEQEVKFFQMKSAKVLPSPAAMAIVGTSTRQFCSAQLQRKGCLSFW